MSERSVDVVVIGAGPVGENAAQYAREGGLSAVLVEKELVGGECSYYACMPSKALMRPVEVAATTAHLRGLTPSTLVAQELLARRDRWVSHYSDDAQVRWAQKAGLDLVRGTGRITGERTVTVADASGGETVLRAEKAVVVATGSTAVVPEELRALQPWTSRDATGVREIPTRLIIVGGGVVACEAATWMAALGAEVRMLVRGSGLLDSAEPFAAEAVLAGLEEAGVRVMTETKIRTAERESADPTGLGRIHGGLVRITTDSGELLEAEEILVATGRRRALDGLGLESVGVGPADPAWGELPPWLHIIGDAGPGAPLTHMGKYEARVLGSRLAGRGEHTPSEPVPVPQVVFTQPQVASVGSTEAEAIRLHGAEDVLTSDVPFAAAAGAALMRDDARGGARLVVQSSTGRILGATFAGPEASELLHAATVAVAAGLTAAVLRHAVPAYPTASELWLRLLEQLPERLR